MHFDIRKPFDQWIEKKFEGQTDAKLFLLTHPRKQMVLESAAQQIRIFELSQWHDHNLAMVYRAKIIEEVAQMFCNAALEYAKQRALSDLERQRRIDEAERTKNIEAEFDEMQKEATTDIIRVYQGGANGKSEAANGATA